MLTPSNSVVKFFYFANFGLRTSDFRLPAKLFEFRKFLF